MNPTFLYLGLVYFGFVFLWRRFTRQEFPWIVAIAFYALVLIFLFRPLTQRYVDVPADYISRLFPWDAYGDPDPGSNTEINDVILQMVPWAHQVRQAWRSLEPPLWNRNAGGGYPLLANGQSGGLSAFRLLALPLPLGYSLSFEAAMKLLAALTFAFLYMRRRHGMLASMLTAVSFGFSTFLIVWLHFPHVSVAALLPALFLALDLLMERATYERFFLLSGVFALLLLNGHPESAAHSVLAGLLYTIFWLLTDRSRGKAVKLLSMASAGVVSLILALPFLLPFLESLPRSQRFDLLRSSTVSSEGLNWKVLVTFFHVNFYGTIREQTIWGPGIAETVSGYAGVLGFGAWLGLLLHMVIRGQWRRRDAFFVIATPLLMGVVMNWSVLTTLFHELPIFSLAANGRLRFVVCWFLAVMAGSVIDLAMKGERWPLILSVVTGAGALVSACRLAEFPSQTALEHSVATAIPKFAVLAAALVVAMASSRRRVVAGAVMVVLVILDLWLFDLPWNPVRPARELYPETPLVNFLVERQRHPRAGELAPFRVTATGPTFFPNSAAMFGLEDVRAHDPMANGKFLGLLRVLAGYSSFDYFGVIGRHDEPYLNFLNVRYLITTPLEDYRSARWNEVYSGPDGKIYENRDALARFYVPERLIMEFDRDKRVRRMLELEDWSDTVVVERIHTSLIDRVRSDLFASRNEGAPRGRVRTLRWSPRSFELDVDAPRWTLVASSQPNWPGWRVYRGSEQLKVIEVNEDFIGFIVPPGHSRITVRYRPLSFWSGAWIALLTLISLVAGLGLRSGRRLRTRESPKSRKTDPESAITL